MTVRLDRQIVRSRDGIHAGFADGELAFTIGLGSMPARCPYKPGDWVRFHGHHSGGARTPSAHSYHGFRGFVLGGMGATILRGLTDDGREWCEPYGHLDPDVPGSSDIVQCACCPDPRWVAIARKAAAEPADLLELLAAMAGAR